MQGAGFRAPDAGGAELWDGCMSMGFEVRTNPVTGQPSTGAL